MNLHASRLRSQVQATDTPAAVTAHVGLLIGDPTARALDPSEVCAWGTRSQMATPGSPHEPGVVACGAQRRAHPSRAASAFRASTSAAGPAFTSTVATAST